jgi:hypothetical protein
MTEVMDCLVVVSGYKKQINKITINEFTYDTILYKLRTNQINYIYMYIKQYFKKLGNKFHCVMKE